jgi:protoporphyrinogen/coproporphyrinogen III oxidase
MSEQRGRHVVVIGGGISGLAAAHALACSGEAQVTLHEADERLGGKIRTSPFAGLPAVDEGADAFLARVPWATELAHRVGLGEQLTSPAAQKASIWHDKFHDLPDGLLLGMPTRLRSMASSSLFTWREKLRAASEVTRSASDADHDTLGLFVRDRFGDAVHERLVDPLVGSIYAADTDHFSLAAVPQIAELATGSRSVLLAARKQRKAGAAGATGPVFYAPSSGMEAFARAVAEAACAAGATIVTAQPAEVLRRDGRGWRIDDLRADAVVLACPAAEASRLLGGYGLSTIAAADVALVTLAAPSSSLPERLAGHSGYLVPKDRQRLVTAVSFGSAKWAHWRADGQHVLRVSLGRDGREVLHLDDDELVDAAVSEIGGHLGADLQPTAVRVSRWAGAFPQYRPHHSQWLTTVQSALPPGIALAGASYHGVGIPACVRSGQDAADALLRHLRSLAE